MRPRLRSLYGTDMGPSPQELAAAKTSARAPGEASAWGAGIGTALGAAGGALASIPSFGTLAPVLIPAGAGLGGALGGAIGGSVGSAQADQADKTVQAGELARQGAVTEEELRQQALNAFLRRGR